MASSKAKATTCVVLHENGSIAEAEVDNNAKVESLKEILGAYPILLMGLSQVGCVLFCAEQSEVADKETLKTKIDVLNDLNVKGKVVFMKGEGDLTLEEYIIIQKFLKNVDLDALNKGEEEEEEEEQEEEDEEEEEKEEEEEENSSEDEDFNSDDMDVSEDELQSGPENEEDVEKKIFDSVLKKKGPVVKGILIEESGEPVAVELDMTPKLDAVTQALGGAATFIGQYSNGTVAMKLREPTSSCQVNKIKLPAPFSHEVVYGQILLIKMDENAEPLNLALEEFEEMCGDFIDEENTADKEAISMDDHEKIKEIARAIGSQHGETIAAHYEKEVEAAKDTILLRDIARAIGRKHGNKIAEALEKESPQVDATEDEDMDTSKTDGEDSEFKYNEDSSDDDSSDDEELDDVEESETKSTTSSGPLSSNKKVSAILLQTAGSAEEHTIDIGQISKLIGGTPTILGDYEDGVLIFKLNNPKPAVHKENKAKLPFPFDDLQILGPIVLMKFDDNAKPQDLTLQSYSSLCDGAKSELDADYEISDEESSEDEDIEEDVEEAEKILAAASAKRAAEDEVSEDDEEEDDEEFDVSQIGSLGDVLKSMFEKDGPIITAVLVKQDGSKEEVEIDMSPKLNNVAVVLGGSISIVGRYDNDAVVLKLRDPNEKKHKKNAQKLPAPFDKENILGDVLLLKMDKDSEPKSFTLTEFNEMLQSGMDKSMQLSLIEADSKANCVIVKEKGEIFEDKYSLKEIQKQLGGSLTVVGQYDNLATVLKLKAPQPGSTRENQCLLPHPFHKHQVLGAYAIVKLDKSLLEADGESCAKLKDFTIENLVQLRLEREPFEEEDDDNYQEGEDSDEDSEISEDDEEEDDNDEEKEEGSRNPADQIPRDKQEKIVRAIINTEYAHLEQADREMLVKNLLASYNGERKATSGTSSSALKRKRADAESGFPDSKKGKLDDIEIQDETVVRRKSTPNSRRIQASG